MTTYQAALDDDTPNIAEELAANQRAISIAEFFEKNKHMLGFDSGARGLVTAVKEAVDNALDATEEAGIRPDISVQIEESGEYYRLVIEDNGPGITREQIPKVFGKLLYGSRFHARMQSRGQQGIGISAAVLYAQLTSGKPVEITSRTEGATEAEYFELIIDTDTNEPDIQTAETRNPGTVALSSTHGTRIALEFEANMRARQQLHDYIKHTAVVNPHARIVLDEPGLDAPMRFDRVPGADLPAPTRAIRPHPHGVELGTLIKMLDATDSYSVSGFLKEEFTRVGAKTASRIIDAFRDTALGRELALQVGVDTGSLETTITDAVANKPATTTERFAAQVAGVLTAREATAHQQLRAIIDEVADELEDADVRMGPTVREHVHAAVWECYEQHLSASVYRIIDAATSAQKDDATVEALTDRIVHRLEEAAPAYRLRQGQIAEFVERAAAMQGEEQETVGATACENITEALWTAMVPVIDDPPAVKAVAANRDLASALLMGMRSVDILAPPTDCLSPIGADLVEAGLRKEFDAEFYAAASRDAGVAGGDPFIVEAGIAYGGELTEEGSVELLRFANRVPLVYQQGACAITDSIRGIGWRNYGLDQPGGRGIPGGPAVVMVHVASTNVPFTSESKDALANIPEIEDEIELAVREAARELKRFINRRKSMRKRRRKQDVLGRILPAMATKLARMTDREPPAIEGALARIMNNVRIDRRRKGDGVRLTVRNFTDRQVDPLVTEIVDGTVEIDESQAEVLEMDGEWYVRWHPTVPAGEAITLEYTTGHADSIEGTVDGIDPELVTWMEERADA
jgi:DNA topoisomerase VI, B subunit